MLLIIDAGILILIFGANWKNRNACFNLELPQNFPADSEEPKELRKLFMRRLAEPTPDPSSIGHPVEIESAPAGPG